MSAVASIGSVLNMRAFHRFSGRVEFVAVQRTEIDAPGMLNVDPIVTRRCGEKGVQV